jgi:predicted AlkP superfamily pyrophosphatase or phosphodiesterase
MMMTADLRRFGLKLGGTTLVAAYLSLTAFVSHDALAKTTVPAQKSINIPLKVDPDTNKNTQPLPKLVLVLVVDGLAQEHIMRMMPHFDDGGFKRLFRDGAWYANAHQDHAHTVTAVGHASILTGAYANQHGVISNGWTDPATREYMYCTQDAAHTYIDDVTQKNDGTSPKNLQVSNLSDELAAHFGKQSKIVAISGKDRGAILLAGRVGTAYMLSNRTGKFVTSTFYRKDYPNWHAKFYESSPQLANFKKTWTLSLPEATYAAATPDGQPWMGGMRGLGNKFPFTYGAKADVPDANYFETILSGPFGDSYTLQFARAAIEGENLGANTAKMPDLLGVSLSSHDYVNHAYGPESRMSQDHLARLDRSLADFFSYLDKRIGMDNVLVALTSDHGFAYSTDTDKARGLDAGNVDVTDMLKQLNAHLEKRFGVEPLAPNFSASTVMLNYDLAETKKVDRATLESAAARFITGYAGILDAFTRTQLENGTLPKTQIATRVQRGWHKQVSGDIFVVQKPHYTFRRSTDRAAATHGSPFNYDTNVPLILMGKPWIVPGKKSEYAAVVDIAPTLASLLGTRMPSASEGRVLGESLQPITVKK